MPNHETLKQLCYDETGALKTKPECRAAMINHMILEEMLDIDEAEDTAEKTLQQLNLWREEEEEEEEEEARGQDQPEPTI